MKGYEEPDKTVVAGCPPFMCVCMGEKSHACLISSEKTERKLGVD